MNQDEQNIKNSLPLTVPITKHLQDISDFVGKEFSVTLVLANKENPALHVLLTTINGDAAEVWAELKPICDAIRDRHLGGKGIYTLCHDKSKPIQNN